MPADHRPGLAFRLPVEVHEQLQTLAAGRGVSVTAVATEILYAYARRGAASSSDETVTLVVRPNPDLVREATEKITAMIRAGTDKG